MDEGQAEKCEGCQNGHFLWQLFLTAQFDQTLVGLKKFLFFPT